MFHFTSVTGATRRGASHAWPAPLRSPGCWRAGGLTLAAAPANASPATCPVPTSLTWTLTGSAPRLPAPLIDPLQIYIWSATYDGVAYRRETHVVKAIGTGGFVVADMTRDAAAQQGTSTFDPVTLLAPNCPNASNRWSGRRDVLFGDSLRTYICRA